MTVPFEQLGPGQVGRLVYQVIGTNGPISNPDRIRYLAPDSGVPGASAAMAPGGLPGLAMTGGGLEFVQLGLQVANLAISAVVLAEVIRMSHQLDRISLQLDRVEKKVDEVLDHVKPIDIRVHEDSLGRAIRHKVSQSSFGDEISLSRLVELDSDLDIFIDRLEWWGVGTSPGLRLSSDVRDLLNACRGLFWGSRMQTLSTYNRWTDGSPQLVWHEPDPTFGLAELAHRVVLMDAALRRTGRAYKTMQDLRVVKIGGSSRTDVAKKMMKGMRRDLDAVESQTVPLYELLRPQLDELDQPHDREAMVLSYLQAWQATDACLLWRTKREFDLWRDEAAWPELPSTRDFWPEPTGVDGATVTAFLDVPRTEAALQALQQAQRA